MSTESEILFFVKKIGYKPIKSNIYNTIVFQSFFQKNGVVYSVKCFFEVNENTKTIIPIINNIFFIDSVMLIIKW